MLIFFTRFTFASAIALSCTSMATAGIGTELAKQATKAATKAIVGESAKQGGKAAVRRVIESATTEAGKKAAKAVGTGAMAKHGVVDEIANAAWRNKGTLAGAAALGTVVTNPEAVIAASAGVVEAGIVASAECVAEPIAKKAAEPLAGLLWLLVMLVPIGILGAYWHLNVQDKKPKTRS